MSECGYQITFGFKDANRGSSEHFKSTGFVESTSGKLGAWSVELTRESMDTESVDELLLFSLMWLSEVRWLCLLMRVTNSVVFFTFTVRSSTAGALFLEGVGGRGAWDEWLRSKWPAVIDWSVTRVILLATLSAGDLKSHGGECWWTLICSFSRPLSGERGREEKKKQWIAIQFTHASRT